MQVPSILVCDRVKTTDQNRSAPSDDFAPRRDYVEIARRLGGTLSGYDLFEATWYRWTRQVEKRIKLDLVESVFAANQWSKHNVFLSTSEKIGIPLAALLSVTKQKIPHMLIAHKLSSGLKTHLLRVWPLYKTFHHIISDCRTQVDYAINKLGIPGSRIDFIYHNVDHRFYRPLNIDADDYILAVGQEERDYKTLLQAMSGAGIRLIVVASSPWSTSQIQMDKLGETTVLSHIPYQELRTLYARARLVVVPLLDVDYAAGSTSILEAMAMAKPLIVSRTAGIADYVLPDETGVYVSPGNSRELRDAILSLWGKSRECSRLGVNARQAVEEFMNLDIYVDRVVQIVRKVVVPPEV